MLPARLPLQVLTGVRRVAFPLVEGGRPRYLSTGATYEAHSDHTFTTMQEVGGEW